MTPREAAAAADALAALPKALAHRRSTTGKSFSAVAAETGVPKSVVHKVESGGGGITTETAIALLSWLAEP